MNLLNVTQKFKSEDDALDYLIRTRWPNGVRCLGCNYDKVYPISTHGKTHKPCRLFECAECGLHFSATTGTLFHDSHLPLTKWFMAMAIMSEAKKGVSALQVSRHIGVSYKTAWHLCHRIRKAMEEINAAPLGGSGKVIEIDETWLGGKVRDKRKTMKEKRERKIQILGIAERGGRVHMQRVSNAKAETLKPVLKEKISPDTEQVITDGHPTYLNVIPSIVPVSQHKVADHKKELEEFGELSAKTVEGAFSLFKRGVIGSYHHLSQDHLDSYLQEFCWRYNRRKLQPFMFNTLLTELTKKKPLTYKKLTREVF
jgi:transposase-like protein